LILINPGRSLVPVFGAGAFWVEAGQKLHNVRDEIVRARLREDLDFVCEGETWTACVAFSSGRMVIVPRRPFLDPLPRGQMEKMIDVATMANREIHHGGHWVLAFSDGLLSALWRDADGDLHFENTFPDNWVRMQAQPREYWVDTLDAIHAAGTQRVRQVGIDPNAQIMRAQGEQSRARPRN